MDRIQQQKLKIELIWWLATLILVVIVILPIWRDAPEFPFFVQNIYFIVAFVTFTRYSFLLPTTFVAHFKWLKLVFIAIAAILFFVMTTALLDFHNFIEERGLQTLVSHLHVEKQTRTINYIQSEMVFFGVGSILAGIALPLRMIISLWRMRNRGTV